MREIMARAYWKGRVFYFSVGQLWDTHMQAIYSDLCIQGARWEQCTGRKDNNSIDIYGGDILEFAGAPGMEDGTATVIWHDAEACWYIENSELDIYDMLYNVTGYCIVIGNIYENPEPIPLTPERHELETPE